MWWASGPDPEVAPSDATPDTATAVEHARQRARLFGSACLWWRREGRPSLLVSVVLPDQSEGRPLPPEIWMQGVNPPPADPRQVRRAKRALRAG